MRIVLDLQACQTNSRFRGIGRYSMGLAQAMLRAGNGHEFWIALNGQLEETIAALRLAFDGLVPQERIVVFDVPGPVWEIDPANAWRIRASELVRESFLARLQPDVVHVSSLFEGLGDNFVASVGKLEDPERTAVTLYDLIPLLWKETYLADRTVRAWYFRKLQSLKRAPLLLAISEHSRKETIDALALPEGRVFNIACGVDEHFCKQSYTREQGAALRARYDLDRPFIMYTGGIDHRKNIEGLIEAFALLPKAVRISYQLAIVCKAQDIDRHRLLSLANQLGLENNQVILTGYVPDDDLVALYNTCHLFVFPSLYEGAGLPALEAMRCGAPVVGSNSSSLPEVIGRDDAQFDPTDVRSMAEKIHQVLTDRGFRHSLREYGLEQAKKFSWAASAKLALNAFAALHERQSARERTQVALSQTRPRLAYISPVPPARSGIADYSAELLPQLARFYDIELVVDQPEVADTWIDGNFPVRTVDWFEAHTARYDRFLYHFGNSPFHAHMFNLLERYPGVVVLHDFFLGNVLNYMEQTGAMPQAFRRALYASHGYAALRDERQQDRAAAIYKYPCNKAVLDRATGVICHSS